MDQSQAGGCSIPSIRATVLCRKSSALSLYLPAMGHTEMISTCVVQYSLTHTRSSQTYERLASAPGQTSCNRSIITGTKWPTSLRPTFSESTRCIGTHERRGAGAVMPDNIIYASISTPTHVRAQDKFDRFWELSPLATEVPLRASFYPIYILAKPHVLCYNTD